MTSINFIYILSLATWIGSIVFFSFFAAPAIFKTLDRDKAGEVVGVIFPRYYGIGYVCAPLALAALWLGGVQNLMDARCVLLLLMAGASMVAGKVVGPKARNLKELIKKNPANKDAAQAKFDQLHSISVKLNATVLVLGLVLLWFTAADLRL